MFVPISTSFTVTSGFHYQKIFQITYNNGNPADLNNSYAYGWLGTLNLTENTGNLTVDPDGQIILSLNASDVDALGAGAHELVIALFQYGGAYSVVSGTVTISSLPTPTTPVNYAGRIQGQFTSPPILTEGVNNLGTTLTLAREAAGIYSLTAGAAVFTANRTSLTLTPDSNFSSGALIALPAYLSTTQVAFWTWDLSAGTPATHDLGFDYIYFKIDVI